MAFWTPLEEGGVEAGGGDQEESEGSPAPGQGLGWASHKERPLLSGLDIRILTNVPGS